MKHRAPKPSLAKSYQAVFAYNVKMLLTLTIQMQMVRNDVVRETSR